MSVYPNDESNVVRVMNEHEIRRLSIASAVHKFTAQKIEKQMYFWDRTRILIVLLATLCLTLLISNSLALNFTVICMFENDNNEWMNSGNQTDPAPSRLLYNDAQTSLLFFAVPVGTIIGTLPISFMTTRFGFRKTFMLYGLVSAFGTLLLPLASSLGFEFVIIARVIEGLGVATSFPGTGALVAEWSPLSSTGKYFASISTHLQLGTVVTMPLGSELCESQLGWQSLYYFLGSATILSFALFYWFYRDSPSIHGNVSQKELTLLQKGKVIRVMEKGERPQIPYKEIFTDKAMMGVFISSIGGALGFQLFFQYKFFNILNFEVQKTGLAAAFPSLLAMVTKFIAGPLSDNVPYLNDKQRLIMFASVSQFTMGFCYLSLAFIPFEWSMTIQFAFTGAIVFSALNGVGVLKSGQMISGQFAYFVMAILQLIMSFVTLLLPVVVAVFCPEQTRDEWSRLFVVASIFMIVVTLLFNFTAEATPRPWAHANSSKTNVKVTQLNADNLKPELFDIAEEDLTDLEKVDGILRQKRLSIVSTRRNSNTSLFAASSNKNDGNL